MNNTGISNLNDGRPYPHTTNPGGRRIPSAIDKRWLGGTSHNRDQRRSPSPRPFRGIGSDEFRITQELRHHMQSMEHELQELWKENAELRTTTFPISNSLSPRRRPRSHTPPRRRCHHSSSDDGGSSSGEDHGRKWKNFRRYKKTRDRGKTPPIDGHTPFSSRILKVQTPRHFIKPIDMKYDRSTDPHVHLRNFEHRMVCDVAVEGIKCRAFPVTLTGLAIILRKLNETTRKLIERFNVECKTINGLEMQVIAKEFIHHEEVNRIVAATKNPEAHTAPRGSGQMHNPRDNKRDSGFRGNPRPPKHKFDNYTLFVASITKIY
ncbi:hypothetical protein PIB30_094409 [Stylosanthes scabra]|uniref:Reverse transcriptase domain-containing protein n=1 Tax=Stylosanthes scabra TaxID=79078 RepID=A0ABU6WX79_9FABA|nr:hypothetical protein [Stylosanthes scabra]